MGHKYLDKVRSSTTGKWIYKYAPTPDKKKRDDWEKDHTVDIEASRGKNHYVMESGRQSETYRRPKLHTDYQLYRDWKDRKEQRKKRLADVKSGKAAKNGKKYVESIMIERK